MIFDDIFSRLDTGTWRTDRQTDERTNGWTDGHRPTEKTALIHTHSVAL